MAENIKLRFFRNTGIPENPNKGDIVFDPFIGVGSTALACLMSNRKYIGFELDEKYYNTCIERIDNYELSNM